MRTITSVFDGAASLRTQWWSLIAVVCAGPLPQQRLRQILDVVLYDGEDLRRSDFLKASSLDGATVSPVLTPVERLLLFVGLALGRLRADPSAARQDSYFRIEENPDYFRRLSNLRRLVHLARAGDPPRAFSQVDDLRLYAQWSSLYSLCAQVHSDPGVRRTSHASSLYQLARLEDQIRELPTTYVEVQSLHAMCLYRRAVHAISRWPSEPQVAAACLRELLLSPRNTVPTGLYFHAARRAYLLPRDLRREVLVECRLSIAIAFALLPTFRFLDRIGICFLLGEDALRCGAPKLADGMLAVADLIAALEPTLVDLDRTVRYIMWLRDEFTRQIGTVLVDDDDQGDVIDELMAEVAPAVGTDLRNAYALLSTRNTDETFVSTLYKDVCQAWIGRLFSDEQPVVNLPPFLRVAASALDRYRDQPRVQSLVRIGFACRLLSARGRDRIDDEFEEYERQLAFSVLGGDLQALVDQLFARGHHVFLRKLGFEYESTRLTELGTYFERVLGITTSPAEFRDSAARVNELLLGTQTVSADLRFIVDGIENRWRTGNEPAESDGFTIADWARSYAVPRRRPDFNPASTDALAQRFFRDCQAVVECEERLQGAESHLDGIPIWAGMAWSALHFCNVLRKVQEGSNRIQTVNGMTDQEWLAKGVVWADNARRLAAEQKHVASLYRSLDVRKRLEMKRGRKRDRRLIEELTEQMLAIDETRLDTTQRHGRRNRAVLRTERSLCQTMDREWCDAFRGAVPINSDRALSHRFALVQRIKSFNYGQLVEEAARDNEEDSSRGSVAEEVVDCRAIPDVFDRVETYSRSVVSGEGARLLYQHLKEQRAVIFDFITHPGSTSAEWEEASRQGWGTICFVVKAGPSRLLIRPFFLDVPEALIRSAVDGGSEPEAEHEHSGLQSDLVDWPDMTDDKPSAVLQELSNRLFPDCLVNELLGCRRLYLCPHRHLFEVPLHAFPLGQPLFASGIDTSYALKTAHLISLASSSRNRPVAPARRYMLVDKAELGRFAASVEPWLVAGNEWGRSGLGVEHIMKEAAGADQTVICCHGQLDDGRPGRARFRLWGGGRLIADDIHRIAGGNDPKVQSTVDLEGSDWVIAACNAGRPRVALRTAPGLALSLVTCGAGRVTSCLYRVRPRVATQFLSFFLRACDNRHPAPFAAAVRGLYKKEGRAGWAEAASFVSYGAFQDDLQSGQRSDMPSEPDA